jgi:glutaryl-CoA dehydrogenase
MLEANGTLLVPHIVRHMSDTRSHPHRYEGTDIMQTLAVSRGVTGVGAFA